MPMPDNDYDFPFLLLHDDDDLPDYFSTRQYLPGTSCSSGAHIHTDENIYLPDEDKTDEIDWDAALVPIEGQRDELTAAISNKRTKNWDDDETIKLLNSIVTYHQRRDMWVSIHKEEFKDQGRTVDSLKQKFKELRKSKEITHPAIKDSFERTLKSYTARQSRTQNPII